MLKKCLFTPTGRKVPPGKLPADVGVIVMNVNSVSFIAEYAKTGMPLIKKRVTIDGGAVNKPCNVDVLIGTSLNEVLIFAAVLKKHLKVLMGGPMMELPSFPLKHLL